MKRKNWLRNAFLIIAIIFLVSENSVKAASKVDANRNAFILVDLSEKKIYLIDSKKNKILKKYSIASGKVETPSPIGTWKVSNMDKWSGGFGTRWIGLNVPWGKFGIHGTNKPGTIGYEASHGCIRMYNKDIEELYEYVKCGMIVTIYEGPNGPFEKGFIRLKPGDRGAAVLEVQRKLKEKGYYFGDLDGIYGEGMKKCVIKFRKDNNLKISHDVDRDFYGKLEIRLVD